MSDPILPEGLAIPEEDKYPRPKVVEVEEIKKLSLGPEESLLVGFPETYSATQIQKALGTLRETLGDDAKIIAYKGKMEFTKVGRP